MDNTKEFNDYARKHVGISSLNLHYYQQQLQNSLDNTRASLTPYVLEEREMRVTQIDIFSRLLLDRIIWVSGTVNDNMSSIVQAQLMFLDNVDDKTITLYIDTPGGSVKSGLSIVDVMDYVTSDIMTINTGMAASMGSILLGAGTVGKRYSLRFSKVMLHQVSSGAEGTLADIKISLKEAEKYNDILFGLLAKYTNKTIEQISVDASRDFWLTAEEAKEYGIIDDIILKKPTKQKNKK